VPPSAEKQVSSAGLPPSWRTGCGQEKKQQQMRERERNNDITGKLAEQGMDEQLGNVPWGEMGLQSQYSEQTKHNNPIFRYIHTLSFGHGLALGGPDLLDFPTRDGTVPIAADQNIGRGTPIETANTIRAGRRHQAVSRFDHFVTIRQ
jgi:hypothetical protein